MSIIWVADDPENLENLNRALKALEAEWGQTVADWAPVPQDWRWLQTQPVFCLTTAQGALDVFREVKGLENQYDDCKQRADSNKTGSGVPFLGLCDEDMLACQLAFRQAERKQRRMEGLESIHSQPKGLSMNAEDLKAAEERKRDAAYDPKKRWEHIQQTIAWAEANMPEHMRRNRPRVYRPTSVDE